jgi:hypothetical protein
VNSKACLLFLALVSTPLFAQEQSNWQMSVRVDAMTDEVNASAALYSDAGDKLLFVCNGLVEPTLSVQFLPTAFLGSSDNVVMIRFDSDPPLPSATWTFVGKGAYTISEPSVEWFSRQVGEGTRLIRVRALDFRDQPVDAAFNSVNGLTAIDAVRAACSKPKVSDLRVAEKVKSQD